MTRSRAAVLLEKITRIIPGIAGYQDREKRRDADKAIRSKAAEKVSRCRDLLSETMNDLSRSGGPGNLRLIGDLERMVTKLDRTEDELRFVPSGYAGWFDREGISLEDLERLYEYDLGLLNAAETLLECFGEAVHVEAIDGWTSCVEEALRDLWNAFEGRKSVMEGREDNGE